MNDIRLLTKEEELQAVRAIGKMLKPEATNGTMPEWNILMDHLDLQRQRAEAAEAEVSYLKSLIKNLECEYQRETGQPCNTQFQAFRCNACVIKSEAGLDANAIKNDK